MRGILAVLLAVHGIIHVLGFLKAWHFAEIPQLTGATLFALPESFAKAIGLLWLAAFLAFVTAASMVLFRRGPWWIVATAGVIVSQLLIIHAWPDAKAGTFINIVLVLPVVVAWADAAFQKDTDEQVLALFSRAADDAPRRITSSDIDPLPVPVRRWLRNAGVVGKPIPRTVRLEQRGTMRLAPNKDEVNTRARQYFRVTEPEFIWRVRLKMIKTIPVAGRDTYIDGRGRMVIKLGSVVSVVDAADEKIDQGALLRFLGEIVWFPAAAASPYIHWEPVDMKSARATMTHRGVSGSALFSFDDHGRFTGLTADRYFGGGPDARIERWEIVANEWKTMAGCLVPVRGEVRWKLATGDFTFYRWELTKLEYDPPGLFSK